jgi:hypothetical protein
MNSNLSTDKLRPDPSVPGRFIYTVSRKREDERAFGYAQAHHKDEATSYYDNFGGVVPPKNMPEGGINQTGERKLLPFKKTSITSKGDITISSNKDKVVFWDKTFKVKTEHMKGILKYKDEKGNVNYVPDDAFVAFVRLKTNARIGVVTLNEAAGKEGWFDLNLRDEYRFEWEDDPIDFYYKNKETGKVYNFNYTENGVKKSVDLNLLYTILTSSAEPEIILTEKPEVQTEGDK